MDGLWFHGIHKYILEKEKGREGRKETGVVIMKVFPKIPPETVIGHSISEKTQVQIQKDQNKEGSI